LASTTSLQDILGAFKAVLDGAGLGVTVYEELPYEGADARSVVLTPGGGPTARPALGLRISPTTRAMEDHCRLQISCFYDDQVGCRVLADKVSQALLDHIDEFESTYDIHDLKRSTGPAPGPVEAGVRESHLRMDFEFYTHRAVT
jgi:hypothetical protein